MFSSKGSQVSGSVNYIEDVFSTQLYTGAGGGAGANQVIDNDIALVSTAAWKTRTVTDGTSTIVYKVKKDSAGNYIVLANSTVSAYYRILIIKFDSAWNITWQKRLTDGGVSQTVSADSLALDPSDNIYVAYGQDGTTTASLAKFNSAGTMQWNRNIAPTSGATQVLSTVIYNTVDGFLYVGGRIAIGGSGLYAKYNTSGVLQWMYRYKPPGTYYGNPQSGYVNAMAHDSAGNVYFCGAEFDSGWKGHVVKINSSGTFQWNKRVSGTTSNVQSIFIDPSDNLYIGYWDGAVFASSSYAYTDVHTTKLNTSTGAIVWDRKIRGYPEGGPSIASITGDSSGNVYTSLGKTVTKHNSSGTFQWSRRLFSGNFFGVSAIDSTVYVTGSGTSNGFITELASDGSTTSGTAYHRITGDELDSAGSQTVSDGNSEVIAHTGTEAAGTAVITDASTTVTVYDQLAVIGSGGLVWTKGRSVGYSHGLFDTVRGQDYWLNSASSAAQASISAIPANPWISSFNIDGFTVGTNGSTNNSGTTYASWTFRKQPKFFDIVTYTGTGVPRTVAHNLGSVPGCILVKSTSGARDWAVYHRSLGGTKFLKLNSTASAATYFSLWNDTDPSSTTFTVGEDQDTNGSGLTYVAYLFAHDAGGFGLTGADNVISCGSFASNGSGGISPVTLGFEPQWLLVKNTSSDGWRIQDVMRGWSQTQLQDLSPNGSEAERALNNNPSYLSPTATGFSTPTAGIFTANNTFIYIAIRRGPMKVPTVGTSVFSPVARTGTGSSGVTVTAGFPVDMLWNGIRNFAGENPAFYDRLRGNDRILFSDTTTAEFTTASQEVSFNTSSTAQTGVSLGINNNNINGSGYGYVNHFFRRAPGFFDEVCYTGSGTNTVTHNLKAVPELMIVKKRSSTVSNTPWVVYSAALGNTKVITLDGSAAAYDDALWDYTNPTSSVFSVRTTLLEVNYSAATYVAYLFATCAGVSKVGSYTGTGTTLQIDCGFTAGARFVLIKRTDSTGGWYSWDTARGIISGNDPYLLWDDTAAEVTNTDYIDTYNAGFELSSTAPAAINASAGTYIFLAIA